MLVDVEQFSTSLLNNGFTICNEFLIKFLSEVDGFTTFAIHDSLGFTRWLWWFSSTRFTFSGCSKKTWFPIPNYISIEVNDSTHDSFRAMANWSRLNSIQFINELHCKMLQMHMPHLLPTKSVSYMMLLALLRAAVNLFPVSLSSLYHRGDNFNRFL